MLAVIAGVLVLAGLVIITTAVWGVLRFPDAYLQLHASGKAAFVGTSALLLAAALDGDGAVIARSVLIVVLLAITTPVASHAIAQAAYHRGEPMASPEAVDESQRAQRPQR
jgi:multicomponent Na+:H+ antiporter subunit G